MVPLNSRVPRPIQKVPPVRERRSRFRHDARLSSGFASVPSARWGDMAVRTGPGSLDQDPMTPAGPTAQIATCHPVITTDRDLLLVVVPITGKPRS